MAKFIGRIFTKKRVSAPFRLLGLRVRIPTEALMPLSCECCVLSEFLATGQSLIQKSPTECGISECDTEIKKLGGLG